MKRLMVTTGVLVLLSGTVAIAQNGNLNWPNGEPPSGKPATSSEQRAPRVAPIGHRQPTASDVPRTEADTMTKKDPADVVLDRKIKGICRGC